MKILVIGSGGREHALVDALSRSDKTEKIFVAPGNGGMRDQAEVLSISASDLEALTDFALNNDIEFTVVGPEVPLSLGIVDQFQQKHLPIIGPTAELARLESSKSYTKLLCTEQGIPTARYNDCSSVKEAVAVLDQDIDYPIVVKANGLAAGKGVVIAQNQSEANMAVQDLMVEGKLGEAGSRVIIEEFMSGEEASFHVFVDGNDFQPMVVSQDHKARFAGDKGPNTGGMGAYSMNGVLKEEQARVVVDKIIRPTLRATGTYFGILYAGLMLTEEGPKLVEYNVRLGDPETQVILPRLRTDLVDVFMAMLEHRLGNINLEWSDGAAATVVLVADTYPGKVEYGKEIFGLEEAKKISGVRIYHAGTRWEDGRIYTAGGRVLNVTATGDSLLEALEKAYFVAEMVDFEGKDYRRDIGEKGLRKII